MGVGSIGVNIDGRTDDRGKEEGSRSYKLRHLPP